MDITSLITVLIVLSVSVERVIEMLKGFIPYLTEDVSKNPRKESRRRAAHQILAVLVGGIITFLSYDLIEPVLSDVFNADIHGTPSKFGIAILFGLLASGGSGFWNSGLRLVEEIKNTRKEIAKSTKLDVQKKEKGDVGNTQDVS